MKWFGAFLLLVSGYLLSRRLAEPGIRHVELLEEGEYLFRLLESEIRNAKIPLPELFADISRRTGSLWKGFFADLSEEMKEERDFAFGDEFECLLTFHLSGILTEEELLLFLRAGRNLLSDDLTFHKNTSKQLSREIREHVSGMKKRLDSQKKVYQALCLSMSALIVIILI